MALTKLIRIDNVPVENDELTDELKMWLRNLADTLNSDMDLLDGLLASIDARLIAGGL